MKVLTLIDASFVSITNELKRSGHEIVALDCFETSFDVFQQLYEAVEPDVIMIDLMAPVPNQIKLLGRIMKTLDNPPTVFLNALPGDWERACSEAHPHIQWVGPGTENFDEVFQAAVKAAA